MVKTALEINPGLTVTIFNANVNLRQRLKAYKWQCMLPGTVMSGMDDLQRAN